MRATVPATPTRWRSSGPGLSSSGSFEATIASIRLPERTSLTSLMERSWPTASGVRVSGKVTVSRSGRIGRASGSGSMLATASSMSGISTTSSCGVSTSAIASSLSPEGGSLLGALNRRLASGLRQPRRQLDPEDAVLICGLGVLGVDVHRELDDAPERSGGKLDLLVGASLRIADGTLTADHQRPASHLQVHGLQLDAGQLDLDHRLPRCVLAAVVDVHARDEGGDRAPLAIAGLIPEVAEELVHLPPHPGEVREWISLAAHLKTA